MSEFTKPLGLTTPASLNEKGHRVIDAQTILKGANHFKQNFHPGPIDGVMGEQTAGAIRRAKYLLGYPKRHVNSMMGERLYGYLMGTKPLTPFMRIKRKMRMAELAKVNTSKVRAVHMALADAKAGIHEYPAESNMQKYGAWFGWNGVYWCCIAISYWLAHAGNKNWTPNPNNFTASCALVVSAARAGSHHLALTSDPEMGDVAIYENGEHIEFFVEWIEKGVTFKAVGGNTSGSDGSYNNGGEVAVNKRWVHASNFPVTNFVRVGA